MAPAANYYYAPASPAKKRRLALKIGLLIFGLFLLAGLAYGIFFAYKIYTTSQKINPDSNNSTAVIFDTVKSFVAPPDINLKGLRDGRINILLLGVAGEKKPGRFLTDTIMVASLNTKTNQVALLSIPRDLYVQIPDTRLQTKINSVYQYSQSLGEKSADAEAIRETVENITALRLDYYAILDFAGFEKIIDALGGINVMNERDIFDPRYPGPNYSYETFELKKGFQHLDGATALKYARERHNDPEGDFGRAKRQQQIMQATKNRIFSSGTFLNVVTLNQLFDALGDSIRTNIQPEEIASFLELAKKLDTQNINNMVLDAWNADSLLKVSHVTLGSARAFVLVPRVGNYSEIQELAANIFDLNTIRRTKEAIAAENATLTIINQSGQSALTGKIKKLLAENLKYKNVLVLTDTKKILQPTTVVYDFTSGAKPFTLNELVKKLPATLAPAVSPAVRETSDGIQTDLVISLGKDLEEIYNNEDGTIDDLNNAREEQDSLNLTSP